MKKVFIYIAIGILVSFTKPFQTSVFTQLHSLSGGTWVMKTKNGSLAERWETIHDSLIRNQAYQVVGRDTTQLEQVELNRIGTEINYLSLVANQNDGKAVLFKLIESKNGKFIFTNPQHDYPQRITYHLISKDSLHAWIEGKWNGKELKRDFYYIRIN